MMLKQIIALCLLAPALFAGSWRIDGAGAENGYRLSHVAGTFVTDGFSLSIKPKKVTITFNATDGAFFSCPSAVADYYSAEYTVGQPMGDLPNAISGGPKYSFAGYWYDENSRSYDALENPPSSSVTLYPAWYEAVSPSGVLNFTTWGGNGDMPTIYLYEGWAFGAGDLGGNNFPADPTLEGYTFGGWFNDMYGNGIHVSNETTYAYSTFGGNVLLYAYWIEPPKVTLTFNVTGGDPACINATADYYSGQYSSGQALGSLPTPVSNGPKYTFGGYWHDENWNYYDAYIIAPQTDVTLFPAWSGNVSNPGYAAFQLEGGTGDVPGIELFEGWPFDSGAFGSGCFPADPTYEGYVFGGWFDGMNGTGNQVSSSTIYSQYTWSGFYVYLYAFWQLAPVTITFDPAGGNMLSIPNASADYYSADYIPGAYFNSLPVAYSVGPRYTNYGYWEDADGYTYSTYTTVPYTSATVTPIWQDNWNVCGQMIFNLEGGSGDTPSINLFDGWPFGSGDFGGNEFPADPILEGYTFGGWFVSQGQGGYQVSPTDIYNFTTFYGNVNVYAYWY
jgi:hypothetical protein